jgi:carbonic anhydrase
MNTLDTGDMPTGFLRDLVERITPSVLTARRAGITDVNSTVIEHTKQTAQRLVDSSRVIAEAVGNGSVAVIGVSYRLDEGKAVLVSGFGAL